MHLKHPCRLPLIAIAASALFALFTATPTVSAQSFALSDGAGDPTQGTYTPGSSFTLAVTFTAPTTSTGYSLWLDTATATAPYLTITNFTLTGTTFTDRTTTSTASQAFNTANGTRTGFLSNLSDLGASTAGGVPAAAGSYAVENIVLTLSGVIPAGTYTLQTTPAASAGRASGGSDASFNFTTAPSFVYTINVVPEPSTWALGLLGGTAGVIAVRRRVRRTV